MGFRICENPIYVIEKWENAVDNREKTLGGGSDVPESMAEIRESTELRWKPSFGLYSERTPKSHVPHRVGLPLGYETGF